MPIESVADLEEGATYLLPTALRVKAWHKHAPWGPRPDAQSWFLVASDRAFVVGPPIINPDGALRLFSTQDDPGGQSITDDDGLPGVPTPFTVRDLVREDAEPCR